MDFSLLINKDIINILIGDVNVFENYTLPYLSGPLLCSLSTQFGLPRTYGTGGGNPSRWVYMQELLQYLNKQDRVGELLSYLLKMERFTQLTGLGDVEKVKKIYKDIIEGAIKSVNCHLVIARKELRIVRNQFVVASIGEEVSFETPNVKVINSQYIQELPERIKDDIENKDYDSVMGTGGQVTVSRSLRVQVGMPKAA